MTEPFSNLVTPPTCKKCKIGMKFVSYTNEYPLFMGSGKDVFTYQCPICKREVKVKLPRVESSYWP